MFQSQKKHDLALNHFTSDNLLEFDRRYPPAPMPPRHELRQNPVNPEDPNFDPVQYINELLGNENPQQNPNRTF